MSEAEETGVLGGMNEVYATGEGGSRSAVRAGTDFDEIPCFN